MRMTRTFSFFHIYDHKISGSHLGTDHAIQINDLEPATKYHYNVSGCGVRETDRTFSTFPGSGSCTFIVYGDTREQAPIYNQTERHKLVADMIAQEKDIFFVINSGDLVSESNDTREWSRFFDATEKLRSVTTYDAIPGNHDTNRSLFRQFFGTDKATLLDCGNMRIAMLDSTDTSSITQREQAEWLTSALRTHEGAKIIIMHYPVYTPMRSITEDGRIFRVHSSRHSGNLASSSFSAATCTHSKRLSAMVSPTLLKLVVEHRRIH